MAKLEGQETTLYNNAETIEIAILFSNSAFKSQLTPAQWNMRGGR
jgi:hypothetical protein